jgi:hypothetical protein
VSGSVLAIVGGMGFAALALGLLAFFGGDEWDGWPWGRPGESAKPSTGPEADKQSGTEDTETAAQPQGLSSALRRIGTGKFRL